MFTHDLKFGLRMLLRKPLLTIGISLSLALGIGANSAVFSLVDAVLFKPLNVGNPSRLVSVYTSDYSGAQYSASSYADFNDFRNKSDVFEDLAAFTEMSTTLRSGNRSEPAYGLLVSSNYFDLLGVKAALGRTFLTEVRNEMKRVTWPSQREVYATTIVVILTSVFFGLYLFGVDLLVGRGIEWLLRRLGAA